MTRPVLNDPCLDADFRRDGYVIADVLSAAEIRHLSGIFAELGDGGPAEFSPSILSQDLAYRARLDRELSQVFQAKIQTFLGGYRLCFCNFVVKKPRSEGSEVPLHQDWSFVDETRFESVGFWCPLIDVDPANGCLSVVRGSHLWNRKPRGSLGSFPYQSLQPLLRERYLTAVPMRAGQGMVFNQRLFHCSPPNRSGEVRVAAGGLAIPVESAMRYYHQDPANPHTLEVFEVDDKFYIRHIMGTRPADVRSLGFIAYDYEPLTPERLAG